MVLVFDVVIFVFFEDFWGFRSSRGFGNESSRKVVFICFGVVRWGEVFRG